MTDPTPPPPPTKSVKKNHNNKKKGFNWKPPSSKPNTPTPGQRKSKNPSIGRNGNNNARPRRKKTQEAAELNALRQKAEHARKKKMASALLAAKEKKERKAAELNTLRQKAENVRKKRLERTEKEQQQDNRVKVAGYTSHDETSHTRRKKSETNQRGYQSNEELLTPDRIRNSDTLNWRGASSPSIDKGGKQIFMSQEILEDPGSFDFGDLSSVSDEENDMEITALDQNKTIGNI